MRATHWTMLGLLPVMGVCLGGCPTPTVLRTPPNAPGMANPGAAVTAPIPSYVIVEPASEPPPPEATPSTAPASPAP